MDKRREILKERELEYLKEKKLCEQSLSTFVKRAWDIIEPNRMYQHNWHIDSICDHLEAVTRREIRDLIINIPPRHMKSTIVSVCWNAWLWGPLNMPEHDLIYGTYHPSLSSRDATKCRRLMKSEWYQAHWGNRFAFLIDQDEKLNFTNSKGGTRTSTTPGGAGTGKNADILIADDPHKVKGVDSEKKREAVFDWWDNEMSSRGNDPETFCRVIIMQRVHDYDLCGYLKEKGDYDELVIPFRYDPTIYSYAKKPPREINDPRTKPGQLLWKNRYTEQSAKKLENSLNPFQKTGQLEQRPTPREGSIFKREWFDKRWRELPSRFDKIINSWDLTQGGETGVAMDVGYMLGRANGKYYVMEEKREKLDIDGQLEAIPKLKKEHKETRDVVIEEAATGKACHASLGKWMTGIVLVLPRGSKEDRAIEWSYIFKARDVLFPDSDIKEWADDAIEEIVSFGPKAKYKDRVDALIQGIAYIEDEYDDVAFEPVSLTQESGWNM